MPFESGVIDRLFFVRWLSGGPRPDDLSILLRAVVAERQAQGRPLYYLAVLTSGADLPNAAERRALDDFSLELKNHVRFSYVVIEGTGFKNAIQRSVITVIGRYWTRGELPPIVVHRTVEEALEHIADDSDMDAERLIAQARTRGLIR